ncbi:MAG TPA: GNAT family N-acetyltransferase [Rhizomicrobium sp.]|jgi:acetyltransferase|nr:GNAT family N-acetyltransferase [Rhizomicrobium sp.]
MGERLVPGRLEILPGLGPVRVRAVRTEDAAPLAAFFAGAMTPDDIRARFFSAKPPSGYVEGLSHPDFAHDMVMLAVAEAAGDLLGGVRLVDAPDASRAEVAISIRSDLKHRGLGRLLMASALDYARRHGTADVVADIQAGNRASLGLARQMGFTFSRSLAAPSMVRAQRHL